MQNKIELSAEQLANLDLVISEKQKGGQFITDANEICTYLAVAHIDVPAQIVAAATNGEPHLDPNDHLSVVNYGKNVSLDSLIALRNNSILKK